MSTTTLTKLHDEAVANGQKFYVDPTTGFKVLTQAYLLTRPCCGQGCRHCPYNFNKGETNGKDVLRMVCSDASNNRSALRSDSADAGEDLSNV